MKESGHSGNSLYKYSIHIYVSRITSYYQVSERDLVKKLSIPWSTYQKDKHVLKSSSFSMPESRLRKYSVVFGVSMEDLLNYEVEVSLFQPQSSERGLEWKQKMFKEFGLS